MFTVEMEIINKNSNNIGFYVPATKEFKKYPRTQKGISKSIIEICENLKRNDIEIIDFNITVYHGKVHYYTKDKKVYFKLDRNLNEIIF